eukprot:scaffold141394_cov17-Tisochrysis_lutea.AAC.2
MAESVHEACDLVLWSDKRKGAASAHTAAVKVKGGEQGVVRGQQAQLVHQGKDFCSEQHFCTQCNNHKEKSTRCAEPECEARSEAAQLRSLTQGFGSEVPSKSVQVKLCPEHSLRKPLKRHACPGKQSFKCPPPMCRDQGSQLSLLPQ